MKTFGRMLRRRANAICAAIGVAAICAAATPAHCADSDLVQEKQMLRVTIGGKTVRLEALIVKRADSTGRLPIAFVNHGRPADEMAALRQDLSTAGPPLGTLDMARRGWLAVAVNRRGYGRSDGPWQSEGGCAPGTYMSWMNADADDIEAAIPVIAQRPDADPTKMITMGSSAGGGTSVTLGARNIPGLLAEIDIAGGEHLEGCEALKQSIPADFKDLGSRSRIPNLWVFAKNDRNHPPDQVEIMRAAFAGAGANLKLVELDPIGSNGHEAMFTVAGRTAWLLAVDSFLRDLNLPTWPLSRADDTLKELKWPASERADVEAYLAAPSEKALAYAPGSHVFAYYEASTLDAASDMALTMCRKKRRGCVIAMQNDTWVQGSPVQGSPSATASGADAQASLRCTQDIDKADFTAAVTDCTQAINLDPKDDSAYANRCGANAILKNRDAALPDCNQAIKLNPKNESAYVNRCNADIGLSNYSGAVDDCTQAIRLNAADERPYNSRCLALDFEGDFLRASLDCKKSLELNPHYVFAYTNLCAAAFGLGDFQDVIEQCSRAVSLDPKAESAYVSLCGANTNLGNYKVALDQCNQAVVLDPKDEQAYTNRCYVLTDLGNYNAALADCKQAIALNPKFALAFDNLCTVYLHQGLYGAAIAACSQAIALDAKDQYGYIQRALAHEGTNNVKDAIADYSQAIAINPDNVEALNERCFDLAVTVSPAAALPDCVKAATLAPQYAGALDNLGFVYLQLGQYSKAIGSYGAALRINPKMASSLYGRGAAEIKSGDVKAGSADIAAARTIDPNIANEMAAFGLK